MAEPPTDDPLAQLRSRIQATQEATERLAAEAAGARRAQEEGRVPPQGWRTPEDHAQANDDLQALATMLGTLRTVVPPELQQQLSEVIRQVLLLLRALIDWWVARLEPGEGGAAAAAPAEPVVEDIPID